MTFKLAFVFVGFLFVCHIQFGFSNGKGDKVYQERNCSSQGGICAKKEYCGDSVREKGLCPKQREKGVECCFEITGPNQTEPSGLHENCGTKGAVCMTRCLDDLIDYTGLCVDRLSCCVAV